MQKQSSRRRLALAGRVEGTWSAGRRRNHPHTHTHTTTGHTKDGLLLSGRNHQTQQHTQKQLVQFHPLFHMTIISFIFFKTSVFIFQSGELNEKSLKKKKNKVETQKNTLKNHSRDRQPCQNGTQHHVGVIMSIQNKKHFSRADAEHTKGLEKKTHREKKAQTSPACFFFLWQRVGMDHPPGPAQLFFWRGNW